MTNKKLKTLKDCKPDMFFMDSENNLDEIIRSAAREWINELEDNAYDPENEQFTEEYPDGRRYCTGAINWIKKFFNLEGIE